MQGLLLTFKFDFRLQKALKAEQEKDEEGGGEKTFEENEDKTLENNDVKMSEDKPSDDKEKKDDTKAEVLLLKER